MAKLVLEQAEVAERGTGGVGVSVYIACWMFLAFLMLAKATAKPSAYPSHSSANSAMQLFPLRTAELSGTRGNACTGFRELFL